MKTHTETLVQFVLVILSVLVHDGLKTRNILNGHPFSVTVTFRVSFVLVSAFISTCRVFCMVVTCSLMALISSSSCGLLWLPFCWSSCFRACSSLDMALSTSIAYTHKYTSEGKNINETHKWSKRKETCGFLISRKVLFVYLLLDVRKGLSPKSNYDQEKWNHILYIIQFETPKQISPEA